MNFDGSDEYDVDYVEKMRDKIRIRHLLLRNAMCEFISTAVLFIGSSVEATPKLSKFENINGEVLHPVQSIISPTLQIAIGWGMALFFAVLVGYRTSGAHMNPAVSLLQLSFGRLSLSHFFVYVLAQMTGGVFGCLITYVVYYQKFHNMDASIQGSEDNWKLFFGSVFATYPTNHLNFFGLVMDQIICTSMFCFIIALVTDKRMQIPKWAIPPFLGTALTMICISLSLNAGNAMNPARDFGPRLFTWILGPRKIAFSGKHGAWFLVPLLCPMLGGVIGGWLYQLTIGLHLDDEDELDDGPLLGGMERNYPPILTKPYGTAFLPENKAGLMGVETKKNDDNNKQLPSLSESKKQ